MKTTGKTSGRELEKTATDREQWKSLRSQPHVPPRREEDHVMSTRGYLQLYRFLELRSELGNSVIGALVHQGQNEEPCQDCSEVFPNEPTTRIEVVVQVQWFPILKTRLRQALSPGTPSSPVRCELLVFPLTRREFGRYRDHSVSKMKTLSH